jgi:hypothetical protein
MTENERRGPLTVEDGAAWPRRIAEMDAKQEHLLDLRLDGDITPEQFRARSTEPKEARVAAELEAARSPPSRLKEI